MVEVKKEGSWWIIGDNIFLTDKGDINENMINLIFIRWEDFTYWCKLNKVIDYPWEYEIDNIYFKVLDDNWRLTYLIYGYNRKNIAFVQSQEILEKEELDNIDIWLFTNKTIWELIEKMEYEGEKILLQ